jgi:hypothetical protein
VPDLEPAAVEIHVLPSECQKFTLAHPSRHGKAVQDLTPVAVDGLKEGAGFCSRHRLHLAASLGRRVDERRDVAVDLPELVYCVEDVSSVRATVTTVTGVTWSSRKR